MTLQQDSPGSQEGGFRCHPEEKRSRKLRTEVLIGFSLNDLAPVFAERLYSKAWIGSKGLRITSRIQGPCLPRGFQDLIGFPREEEVVGDLLAKGVS